MAQRAVEGQQSISPQICVRGSSAVIAVFPDCGQAVEQRQTRTEVVTASTEFWRTVRDNAHSPIRLVIETSKLRDRGLRFVFIEQSKPHGHCCQDARFVHGIIVLIESKRESVRSRNPKRFIDQSLLVCETSRKLFAEVFLASQMREIRKRAKRFYPQRSLVQLRFHRKKGAAFHPAMADTNIFGKSTFIESRAQKFVGFSKALPFFPRKSGVTALRNIVIHRDEVERSCIGGSVRVGIILKPVHKICALRNFVGDLAIIALKLADEVERSAGIGKISRGIERQGGPERIAPEKPRETRALTFAAGAVSRDNPATGIRIGYHAFHQAHARPIGSLLQSLIGKIHAKSVR